MGSVTIGAKSYTVYGHSDGLDEYLNGDPDYSTYEAAVADDPDQVNRVHVRATRLISAMPFTDPANADPSTAVAAVATACYELVIAALLDDAVLTQDSTAQNVKSIEAKGVATEFFAPTPGAPFPSRVMKHLGTLLGAESSDSLGGGCYVAGTSDCSSFDECDRFGLTSA